MEKQYVLIFSDTLLKESEKVYLDSNGYLDLSKRKITNMDHIIGLDEIIGLKGLNIGNYDGGTFDKTDFEENYNLISYFKIFKSFKSLEYIDLRSNSTLGSLPEEIGKVTSLEALYLSGHKNMPMKLRSLPKSIGKLKKLKILELDECPQLTTLPESIGNLTSLQKLTIRNNRLSKIPQSFQNLKSLQNLDLGSSINLTSLPQGTGKMKSLENLNLSKSAKLNALPESIGNLKKLRILNISHCNNLINLPESIGELKSLEVLNLKDNKLISLPESLRGLVVLKNLNLSFSLNLKGLPQKFGNLNFLEILDLSNSTNLITLPETIGNLKKLRVLNLSQCNNLNKLPERIGELESLKELNISSKELSSIPDNISNLKNLEKLNIHADKLRELPGSIGNLSIIKDLDISDCSSIEFLPENIINLRQLSDLNISGCASLLTVPEKIAEINSLGYFNFSNCPKLVLSENFYSFILKQLLRAIPEVKAAIVLDRNGVSIASAAPQGLDIESVSISSAIVNLSGQKLLDQIFAGEIDQFQIKGTNGYILLFQIDKNRVLLVVTSTDIRLGLIYLDSRRTIGELNYVENKKRERKFNLEKILQEVEDEFKENYKIFICYDIADSDHFHIKDLADYLEKKYDSVKIDYLEKLKKNKDNLLEYTVRGIEWCNIFIWFNSDRTNTSSVIENGYKKAEYLEKKIISITENFNSLPLTARVTWALIHNPNIEEMGEIIYTEIKKLMNQ